MPAKHQAGPKPTATNTPSGYNALTWYPQTQRVRSTWSHNRQKEAGEWTRTAFVCDPGPKETGFIDMDRHLFSVSLLQ